jgi:hypothetical protein
MDASQILGDDIEKLDELGIRLSGSRTIDLVSDPAPLFHDHLCFLDHVHHFDAGRGALGRLPRHASQRQADNTLRGTMILLHAIVVIAHLTDFDRGVVLGVIGGDGLGEETHSLPRASLLRQEKVDVVARYVHRTLEVAPLSAYATVNNVTRIAAIGAAGGAG